MDELDAPAHPPLRNYRSGGEAMLRSRFSPAFLSVCRLKRGGKEGREERGGMPKGP